MTEPPPFPELVEGPGTLRQAQGTTGPSRRAVIGGILAAAGLTAGGFAVGRIAFRDAASGAAPATGTATASAAAAAPAAPRVPAAGTYQAGIARPATPQRFGMLLIADCGDQDPGLPWLATVGARILELIDGAGDPAVLPDGAGDLSVTVGLGPRLVSAVSPGAPGSASLPLFAGDDAIDEARLGGDILLAAYASDLAVLGPVLADLLALVPGGTLRWSQRLFRGPGQDTVVRNPLGFQDGIIVPRGGEELEESVWLGDKAVFGGSICVIRRLRLDAQAFEALAVADQEAVIGRHKNDGSPLSGGGPRDQVDLNAKTPEGEFLTPTHSHARAAHPSFTGSGLMLRRGYAFDDGPDARGLDDLGLAFICFQNELRTFVATQQRLDETDDLMHYVTPTASATFLILPGHSASDPLRFPR